MKGYLLIILGFIVSEGLYFLIAGGTADENDDAEQIAYLREYNRRKAEKKRRKS